MKSTFKIGGKLGIFSVGEQALIDIERSEQLETDS